MSLILVVDDVAAIREPIAASLKLAGYATATAANGAEALALVHQEKPDLILLDVSMPVMDGISFLRALRAHTSTAAVPVIPLTADSDRARVLEAARMGAKEYLLKSTFSLPDLLKRVKERAAEALHAGAVATEPPTATRKTA